MPTRYMKTIPGDVLVGEGGKNIQMNTIPDYRLDPPSKTCAVPPCPKCGAELYGYLFIDMDGDIMGCTECVRTKDPWEYVEMLADEE